MHIKASHVGFAEGWFNTFREASIPDQVAFTAYECLAKSANLDPAMLASMGSGVGDIGTGMQDMGLASLAKADPRLAALAAARLEGDSAVNAMGPLEGMLPGALLGGAGGAALGGGMGAMTGDTPLGALGGLGGAGLGALLGGLTSQGLIAETRRAKAYKDALERYRMSGMGV